MKSDVASKPEIQSDRDAGAAPAVQGLRALSPVGAAGRFPLYLRRRAGSGASFGATAAPRIEAREGASAGLPLYLHARASAAARLPSASPAAPAWAQIEASAATTLPHREELEGAFDADLSGVKAHLGQREGLAALGARAAAARERVAFTEAAPGREQVAHEVAHVLQHRRAANNAAFASPAVAERSAPAEREARQIAGRAAAGERVAVRAAPTAALHLDEDPAAIDEEAKRRASAFHVALTQGATDEARKAALDQLRGQPAPMLRKIREHYQAMYFRTVEADVAEYLPSGEVKETLALVDSALSVKDRLLLNNGVFSENETGMLEALRMASHADLIEAAKDPSVRALLKASLNDDQYFEAMKLLEPEKTYEAVVDRIKAAHGWVDDDEAGVYSALLDLSVAQRRQLWSEQQALFSFMGEEELAHVKAMCLGTEAAALKERMTIATDGLGTDDDAKTLVVQRTAKAAALEDKLKAELARGVGPDGKPLSDERKEEVRKQLADLGRIHDGLLTTTYTSTQDLTWGSFLSALHDDVSPEEYQALAASMGISQFNRAKQQVLDAVGVFSDDEDAIYRAFEGLVAPLPPQPAGAPPLTPAEKAKAQVEANQRLRQALLDDPEVKTALASYLNDEEMSEVKARVSADSYKIACLNLEAAFSGVDTDEEGIFRLLTAMSAEDRARLKEEQPPIYIKLTTSGWLDDDERAMVNVAIDTGAIPLAMAAKWTFEGLGTEDEMIAQMFGAMGPEERAQYRLGYYYFKTGEAPKTEKQKESLAKFKVLYGQMSDDLGDDDIQKALDELLGSPTLEELATDEGHKVAAKIMGFRVADKGDIREDDELSSAFIDLFSDTGDVQDQSEARFRAAYIAAMKDGVISMEELALLGALEEDFAKKYADSVAAVEYAGQIASMVGAVIVGVVVAALTQGAAGPAVAAWLSGKLGALGAAMTTKVGAVVVGGMAGATTKVGVSELVAGSHYDAASTEGLQDAISGFVDGALPVIAAGMAAKFAGLVGLSKNALRGQIAASVLDATEAGFGAVRGRMARGAFQGMVEGMLGGAAGEVVLTAADRKVWQQSIWGALKSLGWALLRGAVIGGAAGGLTGGLGEQLAGMLEAKKLRALIGKLDDADKALLKQADDALVAANLDGFEKALGGLTGKLDPAEVGALRAALYEARLYKVTSGLDDASKAYVAKADEALGAGRLDDVSASMEALAGKLKPDDLKALRLVLDQTNLQKLVGKLDDAGRAAVTKANAALEAGQVAEFEAAFASLAGKLSEGELRALRVLLYRSRSLKSSLEGFEEMLDLVWARAKVLQQKSYKADMYDLTSAPTGPNPLSSEPQSSLDQLAAIAQGRPPGSYSVTQAYKESPPGDFISPYASANAPADVRARVPSTFFHYVQTADGKMTLRLYINARADKAPELMNKVVTDMVDNPAFPGIFDAKIAGPGMVSARSDVIVIGVNDAKAAQRILDQLKIYQAASPDYFMPAPPLLTDQVLPGVGLGFEPDPISGESSFNRARAKALQEALDQTLKIGGDRKTFGDAFRAKMREFGVDPTLPHTNLPPGGK